MNWTLFAIATAIWFFFGEHFIWSTRFKIMKEAGLQFPEMLVTASRTLCGLALFNLFVFFFVYGFKVSWVSAVIIVIGSYVANLVLTLLTRSFQGTFMHKLGWLGIPILSVAIWIVGLGALRSL